MSTLAMHVFNQYDSVTVYSCTCSSRLCLGLAGRCKQ